MALRATRRHQAWPSGGSEAFVELAVPLEDLAASFGLWVERLEDDLDKVDVAAAELSPGTQVWFYHYPSDPVQSTFVRVDRADLRLGTLDGLRQALENRMPAIEWTNPEAEAGHEAGPGSGNSNGWSHADDSLVAAAAAGRSGFDEGSYFAMAAAPAKQHRGTSMS